MTSAQSAAPTHNIKTKTPTNNTMTSVTSAAAKMLRQLRIHFVIEHLLH